MELQLNGAEVFLADYGKGFDRARPTVLFVHGAGMDHSVWPLQARHFAYRGWNALAVDLPGHGRSGGELLGLVPAMAEWLGALIQALQLPAVHLVGHSMGALIGLEPRARVVGSHAAAVELGRVGGHLAPHRRRAAVSGTMRMPPCAPPRRARRTRRCRARAVPVRHAPARRARRSSALRRPRPWPHPPRRGRP